MAKPFPLYMYTGEVLYGGKQNLLILYCGDRIFRDQISFLVGPYDTVTITVQPKFLEITCTPMSSELAHNRCFPPAMTCGEVRRYIERGNHEVIACVHMLHNKLHVSGAAGAGDEQACILVNTVAVAIW